MKKARVRKLSLTEMWELYRIIGNGFGEKFLLDEIVEILKNIHPGNIKRALQLMYGEDVIIDNPLNVAILFAHGLKRNEFFLFQDFIGNLNGRTK